MNYELAKELKDAGFPQTGNNWIGTDGVVFSSWMKVPDAPGDYFAPTLEELIEACGSHLDCLKNMGREWWAYSPLRTEPKGYTYAPTPTEAVARLWLALNKKV